MKKKITLGEPTAEKTGTSPSASGPAGSLFEGQVAAHYLLTMLAEADPRGLPGVLIERIELQRAGEGYPLDDVIIHGKTKTGDPACLEIQVKRTITFAPSDLVFKKVAGQLARAFQTFDLSQQRHQFAVATERTSFKITGPYQDVLRWAREIGSASVFFGRLNSQNVGNDDMRNFVKTLRAHLQSNGCSGDDETVWQLLRRFQILTFDYDAPGSESHELAVERARNLLVPVDASRANALWQVLIATAIRVAATGGDIDRSKLLNEIANDAFHLTGTRRNRESRKSLADAARLAAMDLSGSIAGVTLARSAQLDSVRQARDQGRYIEIRGGPGVGKSGLLGMIVDQLLTEGCAIVLTPERTPSGGWLTFKSDLQIEGGPEAFLSDLASDGGAVLFVDSIDFFDDPGKRTTVTDLVRAAASVPGFHVIVTARTDFDKDEPNWLPPDALEGIGRAHPVILDELGTEEIEELNVTAPALRALLADGHPARAVARNLFRLSRMLEVGQTDQLRSEVDLLERWWTTADGPHKDQRDRKRLIADLTDAILAGSNHLEIRTQSSAVDALIASDTLREPSLDRFVFRHDVLREWGIAARLHDTPDKIDQLPFTRAIPASLARGVELAARFVLERSADGQAWVEFLNCVSRDGSHASWRRWSLLAILRSELASILLDRASVSLMENDGALLRELIRTTLAVESRPLVETLAKFGANTSGVPASIFGPSNGSWAMLTLWLLEKQSQLPLRVIPDVVELFQSLSVSMFFVDPLTPKMAITLADWLEEIENAQEYHPLAANQPRFAGAFQYYDLQKLADDVRQAFLLMAARVPDRAQSYLRRLLGRRNPDYAIKNIMGFRGSLAQAAPAELVDVTLAGLIPKNGRRRRSAIRNDTFTQLDHDFLPDLPARGLFLDLLNAAPEHGLSLIRRLADHAITVRTGGKEPSGDGFVLVFSTGPRFFPWERSYFWSRQADGCYAVESSLLALEAWGHTRIERGDTPDQVISDILGPEGSPAAFLLVAVDLLISHWPKTMTVAIPFLGSPELLSIDRTRQNYDMMPGTDLGGWGAIGPKEPDGPIRLADLKKRPSRRYALEGVLATFAFADAADRNALHALLSDASARLGLPEPGDSFADPRFMARHALSIIDPANWPSIEGRRAYVSPPEEAQHIGVLQNKHAPQAMDVWIDAAIQNALEDSTKSSPELAEHAVASAQRLSTVSDTPEDALRSRTNAIVSAAMILARDGADALLDQHEEWARDVFAQAFASKDDVTGSWMRDSIHFNPVAIATLGLIHLWRRRSRQEDRDALLQLSGRDDPLAAQGFGAGLEVIRRIDPRLVRALLRCALTAMIRPNHDWNTPEDTKEACQTQHRECVAAAIRSETAWLNGDGPEPDWPLFPPCMISVRRSLRFVGNKADERPSQALRQSEQLCSQRASLWLRQLTRGFDVVDLSWIVSFVNACADWTVAANGAGFEPDAEIDSRMDEWNNVFFSLLASAFTRMAPNEAVAHVARAASVPDKSFFDIASELVPAIDQVFFNGSGLDLGTTLRLRTLLANRLFDTVGWQRECDRSELSVENRIGPVIAALCFNQHNLVSKSSCYLLARGIDLVDPFLPDLARLIEKGPVPFTGFLVMNLLEVSPRPAHLPFALSSMLTWLQRQPTNTQLWVDSGLGARLAKWLEKVLEIDSGLCSVSHPSRHQIDDVLARLVQVGVAQAHRIEELLVSTSESIYK
ncbi:MAG: hypothetical protein HQL91_08965 [Magnetococcales bacterium]|nr:hypothetical protein [Magnetococcales bacterium]